MNELPAKETSEMGDAARDGGSSRRVGVRMKECAVGFDWSACSVRMYNVLTGKLACAALCSSWFGTCA